jgi:hypothetical protein
MFLSIGQTISRIFTVLFGTEAGALPAAFQKRTTKTRETAGPKGRKTVTRCFRKLLVNSQEFLFVVDTK